LGGTPNEGNLRSIVVTSVGVSSRSEIPPLLPVNVQSPVLFTLWTFRRIFRSPGLLRNIDAPTGASDVLVQEFGAILAEERVFGCQLRKNDGLGELGAELGDLNERLEIAIVNSFFEWPQVNGGATFDAGETTNSRVQQLFGTNVVTDLRVSMIEVDKLWFLLFVRIVSRVIISFLGVASFVRVTFKLGIVSNFHERMGGTSGPSLMSNVLKATVVVTSDFVLC